MFADSFNAMIIAALAPEGWAAMAILVAVAVAAQRRANREDPPAALTPRTLWLLELATLLVIPIGLLVAAAQLDDPAFAGKRSMSAVFSLLLLIVLVQIAWGSFLIRRHRHRWLGTVTITGIVCWWTLGVAFVADMALTDNWL